MGSLVVTGVEPCEQAGNEDIAPVVPFVGQLGLGTDGTVVVVLPGIDG